MIYIHGIGYVLNLILKGVVVSNVKTLLRSALVGYIYVQLGILDKDLPWTLISPRRFSHYEKPRIKFQIWACQKKL